MIQNLISFLEENIKLYHKKGNSIYLSSSFQTQSLPLLHIISQHFKDIQVVFIDTGFLFAETYKFKEELSNLFNLKVITVKSKLSYINQINDSGLFLYTNDTETCCNINKVDSINDLIRPGDIWISGVRRDQSSIRKNMQPIEVDKRGVIRIHPMLDWTPRDIHHYISKYHLPKHALEDKGYVSIGCVPCTHKWGEEDSRGGRWVGSKKTECGLHLNNRNI